MRFSISEKDFVVENQEVWIGDPCYVIPDDQWRKFLDVLWTGNDEDGVVIKTSRGEMFVWGTAYGDGCYPVMRGGFTIGSCGVDAGLLSIMTRETAYKLLRNNKELRRLGETVSEVTGKADVFRRGDAEIGQIKIITSDDEEGDEND